MWGSVPVYFGLTVALLGLALVLRPVRRLRITTRHRALLVTGVGILLVGVGLALPAPEQRITRVETRLDEFVPLWQFHELHRIQIAAPPARVYEALRRVRADEIFLFRFLTWLRRGGRPLPAGILNPGTRQPLLDVATSSGFVRLADSAPHELVIGTVVMAPPGAQGTLTPQVFRRELPPGFVLAAMNFLVTADGAGGSRVATETRVFANSAAARRSFAVYWRLIHPGSALIRRMWLRAIRRRATASPRGSG